ncbi:MAG: Arm DNA-binding domain-containing protein [Ectothiorhodospira sp.]
MGTPEGTDRGGQGVPSRLSPAPGGHTMPSNQLTATLVRKAKSEGRTFKLFDGGGLSLRVRPSGRDWLMRFKIRGRSRETGLGRYPAMSLADARQRRDECRALLAQGIDHIEHRNRLREA